MYFKQNESVSNIASNIILSDESVVDSSNNRATFLNFLQSESITGNVSFSDYQCNSNIYVKKTSSVIDIVVPSPTTTGANFTFANNDSISYLKTIGSGVIYVNGYTADYIEVPNQKIVKLFAISSTEWSFISYDENMIGTFNNDVGELSPNFVRYYFTLLDSNGQAWAWGQNNSGQVGNNTSGNDAGALVQVCGGHTFCKINQGYYHTLALKTTGEAWAWGSNGRGQLGDNTQVNKSTPIQVCGGHTFCQITAGYSFSLAIDNNGQAWGWGSNGQGRLGINSTTNKSTPVAVCGGHTFCHINAGQYFSVAIDNNGQAWAWGHNQYGNLGDNSTVSKSTPIQVCGDHTFCYISAGEYSVLAIDNNGQAWGWGYNSYGVLGDNSTTSKSTPVAVCGDHTFCTVHIGTQLSNGKDSNGDFWSWGRQQNYAGLLVSYCFANSTPVQVCDTIGLKQFKYFHYNAGIGVGSNDKLWGWGFGTNSNYPIPRNELGYSTTTPVRVYRL